MAYADFNFYTESYYGEAFADVYTANKWLEAASDQLDTLTFGRLTFAFPTVEAHAVKVKKAVCAVAEALYFVDCERKAAAAQKNDDGTYSKGIASISSGKESISYLTGSSQSSVYATAAADAGACSKLLTSIAANYLANIPDAGGVNLLYGGV